MNLCILYSKAYKYHTCLSSCLLNVEVATTSNMSRVCTSLTQLHLDINEDIVSFVNGKHCIGIYPTLLLRRHRFLVRVQLIH